MTNNEIFFDMIERFKLSNEKVCELANIKPGTLNQYGAKPNTKRHRAISKDKLELFLLKLLSEVERQDSLIG